MEIFQPNYCANVLSAWAAALFYNGHRNYIGPSKLLAAEQWLQITPIEYIGIRTVPLAQFEAETTQ